MVTSIWLRNWLPQFFGYGFGYLNLVTDLVTSIFQLRIWLPQFFQLRIWLPHFGYVFGYLNFLVTVMVTPKIEVTKTLRYS